jgi:phosphoesterase RecJ-like protein
MSLKGTVLGVLVIELPDIVKLSFRSKGLYPCNQLASRYFDGGGHINAAGGQVKLPLADAVALLKEKLPEFDKYLQ